MKEFQKNFNNNFQYTTPTKKQPELSPNNLLSILNTIKELLKCEICKNYYDLYVHSPFIAKCGHTFCKQCLVNKSNSSSKKLKKQSKCPKDGLLNALTDELCFQNILIKLIIKEVQNFSLIKDNSFSSSQNKNKVNENNITFGLIKNKKSKTIRKTEQKINNKLVLDDVNDFKKRISESKKNKLSIVNLINKNKTNEDKNINNCNSNEYEHIINLNSINVNNEERSPNKRNNKINDNENNECLNTPNLNTCSNNENDDIQLLDEKCDFGLDSLNKSNDNIPLIEDKSIVNISFKNEFSNVIKSNELAENDNYKNETNENDIINKLLNHEDKDQDKDKDKNQIKSEEKPIVKDENISTNLINKYMDVSSNKKSNNNIKNNKKENKEDCLRLSYNKRNINKIIKDANEKIYLKNISKTEKNKNNNEINNNNLTGDKLKTKFLFFDSNSKDGEIIDKSYKIKSDNKSTNLNISNEKRNEIKNSHFNIQKNPILYKKNNTQISIRKNNIHRTNILYKNPNILSINKIKSKISSFSKSKNEEDKDNSKGFETTRIKKPKIMEFNMIYDYNNSKDKNMHEAIKNIPKIKIEKKSLSNSNTLNVSKNYHQINSRNKSKSAIMEVEKQKQFLQNIKNTSITPNSLTYNRKCILSKSLNLNYENFGTGNTYEDKTETTNKYKTIELYQKIKNNKLNSFPTSSLILYKNKNIKSFQKKNTRKTNSICISEISKKNATIYEKIPKLSLNTINDIKEVTPFNVSSISSSRYNSKNSVITKKIVNETGINSTRNKSTNKNSSLKNVDDDEDLNVNVDLVNFEEIINKKNIVEKTTEKLKEEFEYIFQENNNLISDVIKKNKNKYYEVMTNIIEQLKIEKDYPNMELKFISDDFFIGILDENNELPLKGGLYTSIGDFYIGEFVNGKKEGYGTIIYSNGTKYEGIFKNDKHDGFGRLSQTDGEMFVGEWKEGKINGNGMRQHSNGDRYIGNYINNIRNGKGHYIFSNGDSYDGNWINGCANGFGKFIFKNGNSYEGNFKNNIIYGQGIFNMKNGDTYIGFFKYGLISGKGICYNIKGEKYVGNFIDGKKDGFGKLFDKNGKIIHMGIWKDNKFTL